MSCRARRIADPGAVARFDWERVNGLDVVAEGAAWLEEPAPPREAEPAGLGGTPVDLAALERDAFAHGYASGERAGAEAGAKRAEGMLRRMAQTVEELERLKTSLVHQTERQVVQLALALARRVVLRELTLDPDLIAAIAHVALERLSDGSPATIRLHPEDYAVVAGRRGNQWAGADVSVVPDPALARGGCVVESGFGVIDASVDAQLGELAAALLGDETTGRSEIARAE
jgi:flagellar assembly protein FliH